MTSQHERINREACAWIARLHGVEDPKDELAALYAWMAQSPAHEAEIRKVATLWGELNVLTELTVPHQTSDRVGWWQAVNAALQDFRTRAVVVCLLLALIGSAAVLLVAEKGLFQQPSLVYSTAVGEQQRIALEDGSDILLNTNSEVVVDYSAKERNIYLARGEAHFDVAHDTSRPFNVFAENTVVRAVGTAFSVYLKKRTVDVAVTQGRVQLKTIDENEMHKKQDDQGGIRAQPESKSDNANIISAGQHVVVGQEDHAFEIIEAFDTEEMSKKLSWQEGLLKFSGDPLEDVIDEVSRYTSMSIVIQDPSVRSLRIGGVFRVGETEKMLEALPNFGIKVTRINEKVVYLSAATPSS